MNALVRNLPAGITATQSYNWVLREACIEALAPLFPQFTILRNAAVPIQKGQLPILGVYILPEKMTPDGDWNAGNIRFIHDCPIGVSVIIANNDHDAAEQLLDAAWWTVMNGLWCNDGLTNMVVNAVADNTRFEGVMLGMRRFQFGAIGLNNETPIAELVYEFTTRFRTDWQPTVIDNLLKMVITVVPVGVDQTQTQVITVEYDFSASG